MLAERIVALLLEHDEIDPKDLVDPKSFIMKRPTPNKIDIVGRRWFRNGPGGTYHTAYIYIDGQLVHTTPRQYGYGEQYLETATQWLEDEGYIQRRPRGDGHVMGGWYWIRDKLGIPLQYYATDVKRQRDL